MSLHPILDELSQACGLPIPEDVAPAELEAFLKEEMLPKASDMDDETWTTMSDQTQLWTVCAFESFNTDKGLPPLGDLRNSGGSVPISDLSAEGANGEDVAGDATPEPTQEAAPEPAEEAPTPTLTKSRRAPKKGVGRQTHHLDEVITVLHADGNPKREGSISWSEWEALEDGMTVAEFLAVTTDKGAKPRRNEMNGWHRQGLVKIAPAV